MKNKRIIPADYDFSHKSDDLILDWIYEYIDGDFSLQNRAQEGLFGHSYVEGIDDIKKALSFLKTDKAKIFFLEKTRYNRGFCKDIIPTLQPFNIMKAMENSWNNPDNVKKNGRGKIHDEPRYDPDLCERVVSKLAGDQKSLLKVINYGHNKFVRNLGSYGLFKNSLEYLSVKSLKQAFGFWGWNISLSSSQYKSLPEEIIMIMIRKNNYSGIKIIGIEGLYKRKYLQEIVKKASDRNDKEWAKKRLSELYRVVQKAKNPLAA